MKGLRLTLFVLLALAGCARETPEKSPWAEAATLASTTSLPEARRGFKTKPVARGNDRTPAPAPPAQLFRLVHYDSPVGKLPAYLGVAPKDGKRRPAIVWITGGDCNSIDQGCWKEGPPSNDQSASAFRKAGIVLLFPSLRGGNDNPGVKEGYFGEVDDVLAAADFLAKQDGVDPQRVYLGGHSTGGTLVLLTAESTDRFRAVFSFGPVDHVSGYPPQFLPFDTSNPRELELRDPVRWLHSVRSPAFVFEGTQRGNLDCLQNISRESHNPLVHCHPVKGKDHFSILSPVTRLIAAKVLRDDGPTTNITFTEAELNNPSAR
jgi:pimeloyl-ACP methyl ester carboxylesterase